MKGFTYDQYSSGKTGKDVSKSTDGLVLTKLAVELLREVGDYKVSAFLRLALQHTECFTFDELVEVLFEEDKWLGMDLKDTVSVVSKHLPLGNKIDPPGIIQVLKAAGLTVGQGYHASNDLQRVMSPADRVRAEAGYLNKIYRRGSLMTSDLEEDLADNLVSPASLPLLEQLVRPAVQDRPVGSISKPLLQATCQKYGLVLTGDGDFTLAGLLRDQLDYLCRICGKPPLEVAAINVDRARVQLKRAQGTVNQAKGHELAAARDAVKKLATTLLQAEERQRTVQAEEAAKPQVPTGNSAKLTVSKVDMETLVTKVQQASQTLATMLAEVGWPAGLLPRTLVVDLVSALKTKDMSATLIVNQMMSNGLTRLPRSEGLPLVLRLGETPQSEARLALTKREIEKMAQAFLDTDDRVIHHLQYILRYEPDTVIGDGLRELLGPVKSARQVAARQRAAEEAELAERERQEAETAVVVVPTPTVKIKTVRMAKPAKPLVVLKSEVVVPTVAEKPPEDPQRVVKGSRIGAELHRASGWLLLSLEVQGWPTGVLLGSCLLELVKQILPKAPYPEVIVNNLAGHGFTGLFTRKGKESILRRLVVTVDTSESSNVVVPLILARAEIDALAARMVADTVKWQAGLEHIKRFAPHALQVVVEVEPAVEAVVEAVVETEVVIEAVTEGEAVVVESTVEETVELVAAALEEVPAELVPVASAVLEETTVPEEEEVMSENVNEVSARTVRCSPVAAECHRVAGVLLEWLKPHGWPDAIVTSTVMQKVVLLVRPDNRYPGVVINNEMVARGLTPLFYRGGRQSVFRRDLVTFDTESVTVRLQPRIVPDEDVRALAESLWADKAWWDSTFDYLRKWVPQVMASSEVVIGEAEPIVGVEPVTAPSSVMEAVSEPVHFDLPTEPLVIEEEQVVVVELEAPTVVEVEAASVPVVEASLVPAEAPESEERRLFQQMIEAINEQRRVRAQEWQRRQDEVAEKLREAEELKLALTTWELSNEKQMNRELEKMLHLRALLKLS